MPPLLSSKYFLKSLLGAGDVTQPHMHQALSLIPSTQKDYSSIKRCEQVGEVLR